MHVRVLSERSRTGSGTSLTVMTSDDLAEMRRQYPHATLDAHMLVDGEVRLRCGRCKSQPVPCCYWFVMWCDDCLDVANRNSIPLA